MSKRRRAAGCTGTRRSWCVAHIACVILRISCAWRDKGQRRGCEQAIVRRRGHTSNSLLVRRRRNEENAEVRFLVPDFLRVRRRKKPTMPRFSTLACASASMSASSVARQTPCPAKAQATRKRTTTVTLHDRRRTTSTTSHSNAQRRRCGKGCYSTSATDEMAVSVSCV